MAAVTVSRSADCLIAVKQVPAERAAVIDQEADLLRRLDHPGVVRLIDVVDTPDGDRAMHTEFVSSDTWDTRPLTEPAERAAAVAALAATVADLHDLGVAHLQLTPAHVLHAENDRPVLCGLSRAAEATAENRHTDLAALADLCHGPNLEKGALTERLSELAEATRAGRLNARELSRKLDPLAAKRPTVAPVRAARGGLRRHWPRRKSLIAAGAVVAAAVPVAALGAWSRGPEVPASNTAADDVAALRAAVAANDAAGAGPDEAEAGAASFDGRGTEWLPDDTPSAYRDEPAQGVSAREAAAVLELRGRRYAVGATGDFVQTGDWDCDGHPTPAIVRPSTGDVALFDAWPEPGETVSVPARWQVDSPTGAEAVRYGPCDLLRVYTTTGSRLLDPSQDE